jgi:succinate dehydrogenase / fumarate reductase cytochrome b subunit
MSVTTQDAALGANAGPSRLLLFWMSSIGKKVSMALSGLILFAYVCAHLLGNLQVYVSFELINNYAKFLHTNPEVLWIARVVLLAAVTVHAVAAVQLWFRKRAARPIEYHTKENIQATAASRTMIVTGLLIGLFIVYHVLDLTVGACRTASQGFEDLNPAFNVTHGFAYAPAAITYIVAMCALGLHLWHGVYSMFGSLGVSHPRYMKVARQAAALFAAAIAIGNISFPVAVLTGLLHY